MQEDTHKWVRMGSLDPASTSQRKTENIYVLFSKKNKSTCREAAIVRPSHAGTHPTNVFWVSLWMRGDRGGSESVCQSSSNISVMLPVYTCYRANGGSTLQPHARFFFPAQGHPSTSPPPQPLPSPVFTSGERSLAPCLAGGAEPGCHGHVGLRAGRSEAKLSSSPPSREEAGGQRQAGGTRRQGGEARSRQRSRTHRPAVGRSPPGAAACRGSPRRAARSSGTSPASSRPGAAWR